jgi:hypothetical protein
VVVALRADLEVLLDLLLVNDLLATVAFDPETLGNLYLFLGLYLFAFFKPGNSDLRFRI